MKVVITSRRVILAAIVVGMTSAGLWGNPQAAAADTNTPAAPAPPFKPYFTSFLFSQFYGPSIETMNAYQPDIDTGQTIPGGAPIELDSLIGLTYKFTPAWSVGLVTEFLIDPASGNFNGSKTFSGANFTFIDPFLQIKDSAVIDGNGWNLSTDLRIYAPTSASSQANGKAAQIRSTQVLTYMVPRTRLTLSDFSFERFYAYPSVNDVNGNNKDFEVDISPNLAYQITPTIALTLWTDLVQLKHLLNGAWINIYCDLEPGFNWDITPNWSFNPYLNIFPGNPDVLNSTSINFIVAGKFF